MNINLIVENLERKVRAGSRTNALRKLQRAQGHLYALGQTGQGDRERIRKLHAQASQAVARVMAMASQEEEEDEPSVDSSDAS